MNRYREDYKVSCSDEDGAAIALGYKDSCEVLYNHNLRLGRFVRVREAKFIIQAMEVSKRRGYVIVTFKKRIVSPGKPPI